MKNEKPKKPKICILFCGGTIVMSKDDKTGALDMSGGTEAIINLEPQLKETVDMDVIFIDNIDSTNVTTQHWENMIKEVVKGYKKYDGFVITHGTNTLGYTSSALSFALKGIGKPVVLTGAQIPADQLESDARRNFVNSVRLACMDIAGVYVIFGSKIIIGSRAKKDNESELDAFKTFNALDFGEIRLKFQFNTQHYTRRHNNDWIAKPGFVDDISVITLEPGINGKYLNFLYDAGIKGMVIRAYGSGDIPYHLLPSLKKARDKKIPIVVTTQCPNGVTQMGLNDVGLKALEAGIIQAFDMSMETMTTKLRWLLHQKTPYNKLKERMETDYIGEIVPPFDEHQAITK